MQSIIPIYSFWLGKPQKKERYFFSGPATKALPTPPRAKWPGHKKETVIFIAASLSTAGIIVRIYVSLLFAVDPYFYDK